MHDTHRSLILKTILAAAGLGALLPVGGCTWHYPFPAEPADTTGQTDTGGDSSSDTVATLEVTGGSWDSCSGKGSYEEVYCYPAGGEGTTGGSTTGGSSTGGGFDSTGGSSTGGGFDTTGGSSTGAGSGSSGSEDTDSSGLCDMYIGNPPAFPHDFCQEWVEGWSGPFAQGGECCFTVTIGWTECCGRPFLVEDAPRLAASVPRGDWRAAVEPRVDDLDDATRGELARAWADDGRAEHASVAAFARFVMQLLALGAPAELLVEAHVALADEVEHARLCFALASAYRGVAVGPGPLAVEGALEGAADLTAAALAALYEGCIGETLAAVEAGVARDCARDPVVASVLTRIAADELRHAALAWRFLAWALERGGPALHVAIAQAVDGLAATVVEAPTAHARPQGVDLKTHGRLTSAERSAEGRAAVNDILLPAARALLHHGGQRVAA